ncbi:MAG: hypothetical protein MJ153_01245 [Clostridia bacterium]|nr:hypothetical protein [Clostridia bacterium]
MSKIFFERRKSKRGAMLILVLLIVSLAVILIGSALTMTRQTRTRYYSYAEGSQARLTATSIAESLWDAIYIQEIDDATLKKMANGAAVLNLSGSVPGANGVSQGKVVFHAPAADGKINIDCSATVGGTTSNVRLTLDPPPPKTDKNLFEHVLNLAGGSNITEMNIGEGGAGKTDNTILIQGDGVNMKGTCQIHSDMFVQGVFTPQDNQYLGNLIFWGPDAKINLSGSPKLGSASGHGLYFVSNSTKQQSVLDNGANLDPIGNGGITEFGLYNANFVMNKGNAFNSSDFIKQKGIDTSASYSGSVVGAIDSAPTSMEAAIIAKAIEYAKKDFSDHFPTLDEAQSAFGCSPTLSGTAKYSGSFNGCTDKGAGSYEVTGNLSNELVFDLNNGDYVIYVNGKCDITGKIKFINGGASNNWGRIILKQGIEFSISTDGEAGIYSFENGKPHCYVYGNGNVKFNMNGNGASTVEAYVGLYDPAGTSDSNRSVFICYNSAKYVIKGRIACPYIEHSTGGHLNIPYCVDPTYVGGDGKIQPIVTEYSVEPFVYFS